MFSILDAVPTINDPVATVPELNEMPATIEFEYVTFAYPGGRQPAHRGLSFRIEAGERIGIVGISGSGKSSIVRLLLRNYDPQEGCI